MKRALFSSLSCLALCAACGSGSTGAAAGSGQISGTVGGEAFVFRSGLAYVGENPARVDIILSDADGVCSSLTQQKIHPGETIVQAYNLTGTVPGKFSPKTGDVKYASVKSTCAAGQSAEGQIDKKGDATTTDFTISSITSTTVDGKLTVTFDDGSSVTGSFSVPVCADDQSEKTTCY